MILHLVCRDFVQVSEECDEGGLVGGGQLVDDLLQPLHLGLVAGQVANGHQPFHGVPGDQRLLKFKGFTARSSTDTSRIAEKGSGTT